MASVSDKQYIKLFFTLLKANPTLQLFEEKQEDLDYITNLSCLLDNSYDTLGFKYQFSEGKLISSEINMALMFITADYDGVIADITTANDVYDEQIHIHKVEHVLGEGVLRDREFVRKLSNALYFKKLTNAKNFGDAKKYLVKEKVETANQEELKAIWKALNKFVDALK